MSHGGRGQGPSLSNRPGHSSPPPTFPASFLSCLASCPASFMDWQLPLVVLVTSVLPFLLVATLPPPICHHRSFSYSQSSLIVFPFIAIITHRPPPPSICPSCTPCYHCFCVSSSLLSLLLLLLTFIVDAHTPPPHPCDSYFSSLSPLLLLLVVALFVLLLIRLS